ncbi:MAG: SemiSWEET family transporter [Alphaproteobacteria bacterium]
MHIEFIAFVGSLFGVGSRIPQIFQIIRTGDVSGISAQKYWMTVISSLVWVLYGVLTPTWAIVFWNSVAVLLSGIVLVLKNRSARMKI